MPGPIRRVEQTIAIDAPIERVFSVVTDFARYPEFLPEMKRVVVEAIDGRAQRVAFHLHILRDVEYTLAFEIHRPIRVTWRLVDSRILEQAQGAWDLVPTGERGTLATYSNAVALTIPGPATFVAKLVEIDLPVMLARFKARAESEDR